RRGPTPGLRLVLADYGREEAVVLLRRGLDLAPRGVVDLDHDRARVPHGTERLQRALQVGHAVTQVDEVLAVVDLLLRLLLAKVLEVDERDYILVAVDELGY